MTRERPLRMIETVALVALMAVGCSQKLENYGCPTVDATGDPNQILSGSGWTLDDACAASYDRVQSGDWCSQLVYDSNGVRMAILGHGTLVPMKGDDEMGKPRSGITFAHDPNTMLPVYTSTLTFEGPGVTSFPAACLRAYGAEPTCDDLISGLDMYLSDNFAAQQSYRLGAMLPYYPIDVIPQPYYYNFDCLPQGSDGGTSGDGCRCTYTVRLVVPDKGTWVVSGSMLSLFSVSDALPYDNDFAATGAQLQMVGHAGLDLMGQQGLRTLVFAKH
jgi:hypothetical protein